MFQNFLDKKSSQGAAQPTDPGESAARPASAASRARPTGVPQSGAPQSGTPQHGTAQYPGGPIAAPIDRQMEMVARHAASVEAEGPEETKAEPPVEASRTPRPAPERDTQKLVVGPRIRLKGEVSNCDELIVEGHFEGKAASRRVRIAQGGSYEGEAEVETAEMSGAFDGALTVSDRLIIRASGRVSGTLRYHAIEIESGGRISGDVQVTADEDAQESDDESSRSARNDAPAKAAGAGGS